jgi:hypothetical protein
VIFDELRPYADSHERDAMDSVAERLRDERPVPRAGFRAELRAHLRDLEAERHPAWRPKRLRVLVGAYAGSGFLLLIVAALGLSGAGPLGY